MNLIRSGVLEALFFIFIVSGGNIHALKSHFARFGNPLNDVGARANFTGEAHFSHISEVPREGAVSQTGCNGHGHGKVDGGFGEFESAGNAGIEVIGREV